MKVYAGSDVRNVAIVGHAHSGKTELITAILKTAKSPAASSRENGGAVTQYDEEEIARKMTMSNAAAYAEWDGIKVNMIDTPGFHMFLHEVRGAMLPAETAIVVINAQTGVESGTERVWNYAAEIGLPRIVVMNQVDHPKADSRTGRMEMLEGIRGRWGRQVVPVQLPIVDDKGFHGVVDLVTMEAYLYTPDGDGRGTKGTIPHAMEPDAKAAHEALIELVAEGKDELMEEFFAMGTIPEEHLVGALHEAIREDRIFPVLYVSGLRNVGTDHLLDFLKVYAPSPVEREAEARCVLQARLRANGANDSTMRKVDDAQPVALYVYKTMVDPFAGRISFFKVISGCVKNDAPVENYTRSETETLVPLVDYAGTQADGGYGTARGRPGRGCEVACIADGRHVGSEGA